MAIGDESDGALMDYNSTVLLHSFPVPDALFAASKWVQPPSALPAAKREQVGAALQRAQAAPARAEPPGDCSPPDDCEPASRSPRGCFPALLRSSPRVMPARASVKDLPRGSKPL